MPFGRPVDADDAACVAHKRLLTFVADDIGSSDVAECSFRGRLLKGRRIAPPSDYTGTPLCAAALCRVAACDLLWSLSSQQGYVLRDEEQDEAGGARRWSAQSTFNDFVYWERDLAPKESDKPPMWMKFCQLAGTVARAVPVRHSRALRCTRRCPQTPWPAWPSSLSKWRARWCASGAPSASERARQPSSPATRRRPKRPKWRPTAAPTARARNLPARLASLRKRSRQRRNLPKPNHRKRPKPNHRKNCRRPPSRRREK